MKKTVILLASMALLVAGCGDKDESTTSQSEESSVEEVIESGPGAVVEEVDVTTESAEPTDSEMVPEAAGETMDKAGEAANQGEEEAKGAAGSAPGK
jgi:PBP1b-binding outer membrane lipoprotein LpoB